MPSGHCRGIRGGAGHRRGVPGRFASRSAVGSPRSATESTTSVAPTVVDTSPCVPVGSPVVRLWSVGHAAGSGGPVDDCHVECFADPRAATVGDRARDLGRSSAHDPTAGGSQSASGPGSSSASVAPRPDQSAVQPPVVFAFDARTAATVACQRRRAALAEATTSQREVDGGQLRLKALRSLFADLARSSGPTRSCTVWRASARGGAERHAAGPLPAATRTAAGQLATSAGQSAGRKRDGHVGHGRSRRRAAAEA